MNAQTYSTQWLKNVGLPTLLLLAITIGVLVVASRAGAAPYDVKCASAVTWSADDAERPCVKLTAAGGTLRYSVSDADGTLRYAGTIATTMKRIVHVRVAVLWEDGSFEYRATGQGGRTLKASVGNLLD
jgi:hypothetical protein